MAYHGPIVLEDTLDAVLAVRDSSNTPVNADALPTYRIYGSTASALVNGTVSLKENGTVSSTTGSGVSPIVVTTSAAHGLSTGVVVTIAGVGGNTAANGTFPITVTSPTAFSLDGTTGNGAYTSGGTWNTAGLYALSRAIAGIDGFAAGNNYYILFSFQLSSVDTSQLDVFTVS